MIPRFAFADPAAKAYFDEHGFVVVRDALASDDLHQVRTAWDEVVRMAAGACSLNVDDFAARFPQNRDLWKKSPTFCRLLLETGQWRVAAGLLGVSGVRLFHDHAICKPTGRSGTIPWHQDSAYWPLDRVGISLWTPTNDVPLGGGCLKVLDRSHLDGPGEPQDFLAATSIDRDADTRTTQIPVARGETVVLNGLTWHGSDPNVTGPDRLAYLTLWVPATARFVPEHAGWHPTAAHIRVAPGARLDGEWFPRFGEVADHDEGQSVVFPVPPKPSGPTMFTASRDIGGQLAWLLGRARAPLGEMLDADGIEAVVIRAVAAGLTSSDAAEALRGVLGDLVLQERVRTVSTARDVYLGTVVRWWQLLGARIAEVRDAV